MAKIDRALIIRRLKVPISMEYAQMCAESCEKNDLPYEFIEAVEFLECGEAFKSVGSFKHESYNNTMGNCCCHSSHIKSWKRIVEIDKPCIILEHDAIVKGDVRNIDIPDMAATTFGLRVANVDDYEPIGPIEKMIQIEKAVGVHACALTPNTAKWLYEDAINNGVAIGVDRWLMMKRASGLPLYISDPPQVVCWARVSTSNINRTLQYNSTPRSQVINYRESITENWKKGLK